MSHLPILFHWETNITVIWTSVKFKTVLIKLVSEINKVRSIKMEELVKYLAIIFRLSLVFNSRFWKNIFLRMFPLLRINAAFEYLINLVQTLFCMYCIYSNIYFSDIVT